MKRLPMGAHHRGLDVTCEHRKFVATQTRQQIAGAGSAEEAFDHHLQHAIAGRVAVDIVDALEAVEIEHVERVRVSGTRRRLNGRIERRYQRAAIGQARQRILHGEVAQRAHLDLERWRLRAIPARLAQAARDEHADADHCQAGEQRGLGRGYATPRVGQ
jgi:hypothetical protein